MDFDDIELKLLMNHPIEIEDVGDLYSPTLKEVISIGYSIYNLALSYLLFSKRDNKELRDLEDSNFHLLCFFFYQDSNFRNYFNQGLNLCFRDEASLIEIEDKPVLKLNKSGGLITIDNLEYVQKMIKIANKVQISNEEEYSPANSKARELVEMIKKNKEKRLKPKPVKNLHSLISGMAWKSNYVNTFNIFDLSIYQFYDGYYRLENIDHYNSILTGIYTGNIDAKNIKMPDIDWAKIIIT